MVHADTKRGFTGSLKSTQMWKIHRGTDDSDKPEKVYKYDDQDGLSVLDSSQESSPRPVRVSDVTPPPRCAWRLHADPRTMCMIIIQWASHLTTTRQPNRKLGLSLN
jgi:hypothetical protein